MADRAKVEYSFLGKSGVRVSNICLGTLTFGQPKQTYRTPIGSQASEELAHEMMDRFAELGGNFLDTADMYNCGRSEEILGSWLSKQDRSRFVVATKVRAMLDPTDVNQIGLSRRHITEGIERSLERLQTPYVDLYQSHLWDSATPLDDTLRTFDDLIRCGKVHYLGVSNVCGWQMQSIVDQIKMMGLNRCVSLQQEYNLLCRHSEYEEFMVCRNEGIAVLPWGPLKGGLLTGKYKRDEKPSATSGRVGILLEDKNRVILPGTEWSDYCDDDNYWRLMDTLAGVANNHGKTIPQVALRWLIQKDVVASVIIGVMSVKQLEDNMGASSGWELSTEEMASLDTVRPLASMYPYSLVYPRNRNRLNPFNKAYDP